MGHGHGYLVPIVKDAMGWCFVLYDFETKCGIIRMQSFGDACCCININKEEAYSIFQKAKLSKAFRITFWPLPFLMFPEIWD